ncbi:MAG TPA: ribosome biogenesis GTP-binding protein YihA/YsxC [Bacillota bacterium]|nr:ribosome biogenesis GTP-binding protein YihA/YsxC [Bacillota bacterium]HPL98480.1 ribosome biogenesis GTP-binding protein YihA/YsxC [Bacillota bacterium]HPW40537.1 ribosome biogenesis GTP-binding protein YihA/YsxC [Bacillota bacterium]HQO42778.1 ribosome biogenesis GTP-binding protein YihA/YsxC [Bacillota bacterium]HQQ44794.1 ribosome biogenesis GTP-binding protein YihA/YsxC [Bacillota bacterium]
MIIKKCEFIKSAVHQNQYPELDLPEIAFSGRSNVGKSSLINSLLNRKKLVKTSSSPGKTRLINFFMINDEFVLVDLPGYGYAAVSKSQRQAWGKIIENYLRYRENLKNVVLLVDIRHEPTADDKLMYDFIKYYRKSVTVVATKLDKITRSSVNKNLNIIKQKLDINQNDILIPYSSETHVGREELWEVLLTWK